LRADIFYRRRITIHAVCFVKKTDFFKRIATIYIAPISRLGIGA